METIIRKNNRFEILTPSGWSDFDGIRRKKVNRLVKLSIDDKELICTPEHRIKIENNLIESELICSEYIEKEEYVYDPLEVKKGNEYYSNDIISHNCEFQGSSGTLIAGWKLKELVAKTPLNSALGLNQYEPSYPGHSYAITVDVSEGKGLDYSVFHVTDISSMPFRQVSTYRSNRVTPGDLSQAIYASAKAYNNAMVLIEHSSLGPVVAQNLYNDLEYENILWTKAADNKKHITLTGGAGSDIGIKMSKSVKATGCSILKLLIEGDQYIINDFHTIEELSRFSKKNDSYQAEEGWHDDTVMPLVIFGWLSNQNYFKSLTNLDAIEILKERSEKEMYEELVGLEGFIVYGAEEPGELDNSEFIRMKYGVLTSEDGLKQKGKRERKP